MSPLQSGNNQKAISKNISELMHSGRSHGQSIGKSYDREHIKMARSMMK